MNFSVMLDCSRNAVFKIEEIKNFVAIVSRMGYKELYLYTEDTYEIKGEQYFGYLRGKYTLEELKDLDAYCASKGVELVPCIQTLAHLNAIFRWKKYIEINDIDDILLIDDERTYELIEKMISTVASTFRSRKVHIGFDEAHNVGRGQYLDKNGDSNRHEILLRHLNKVNEIVKKYGLQPMMWSDMFFRFANKGMYLSEGLDEEKLAAIAKEVPENMTVTYWDYYQRDEKKLDEMFALHKKYFKNTTFAGGAITWFGYAPHNEESQKTARVAIKSAKKHAIKDMMVTLWADSGGQCSFYSVLPTLLYYKELADGNDDLQAIKRKFYEITGENWDAFMALDLPNKIGENNGDKTNPSAYMLYNDYFSGVFDCFVCEGDGETYRAYAKTLKNYAKKGKYAYVFDVAYKLSDVLADKYELGVKTRKAYHAKDIATLKRLANKEYAVLPKKIKALSKAFDELWAKENKTAGIEIEDIRLGGLIRRTESCRTLLKRYIQTGAPIAELEEPLLDFYGNGEQLTQEPIRCNQYLLSASVNVLSHGLKHV